MLSSVTVKLAASLSDNEPAPSSVAVKLIVSDLFQFGNGEDIVATLPDQIETSKSVLPEYVQLISSSSVSSS